MPSQFPGAVPNYPTWKESNAGTRITDEVVKVPAGSPYRTWLVQKPRLGDDVVARVQGSSEARTRVPWGTPILPGTFALRDRDAALDLHPNDANLNILFTYVGIGSVVRADIINALQDDMKAVMNWIGPSGGNFIRMGDADYSENSLTMFDPNGGNFIVPANMYQDDGQGSMVSPIKIQAQRGFFVRSHRYGAGGSVSLAAGWNRILTVSPSPLAVHGIFEVAYSIPLGIRGRMLFTASASETGRAQIVILSNTCNGSNTVFTSMRILRPSSGGDAAALEIYLSSPTSVILEFRQIDGSTFDAAGQTSSWSFLSPATAGSLTGMTAYELNVADSAFAVNCNNNGFGVSASGNGMVFFQGANGTILTSAALTPTIANAIALGTTALPFGPVRCTMAGDSPSNHPVVRYNSSTKSLVADSSLVYANGTFNLVDAITSELVTVQIQNGVVVHMDGAEQ